MKKRLISAAVGLSLLIIILLLYHTFILNAAIAILGAISIYEFIRAIGLKEHKPLLILCLLFALWLPFAEKAGMYDLRVESIVLFILCIFIYFISSHEKVRIESLVCTASITIAISFSLTCLITIRDQFPNDSLYYIFLVFIIAWVCDAGAYFVGRAIGKHKMSPIISPNKTFEGAIGGIIVNGVVVAIVTIIFSLWVYHTMSIQIISLILVTLIGSIIAILGDLSASAIKRQFQIKDFGNLLPGHGGAIDRFDSMFFVAPFLYFWLLHFPILGG